MSGLLRVIMTTLSVTLAAAACSRTTLSEELSESGDSAVACTPSCLGRGCAASNGCGGTCVGEDCADGGATGVVLFGGSTSSSLASDTWIWDGIGWTRQDINGPSQRSNAQMAALDGTVMLFGGRDFGGPAGYDDLGDTWTYDGRSWTRQGAAGPLARDAAGMVALDGAIVLFGGFDCNISLSLCCNEACGSPSVLDDMWSWDGSKWTQLRVPGTKPPAQARASMGSLDNTIVLLDDDICGTDLFDTWVWNGAVWTVANVDGPKVDGAAMSPLNGALVLFGGAVGLQHDTADTWTWDGSTWTKLDVTGPSARDRASMATLNGTVVLFGGETEDGSVLGDTWTWDGSTWTKHDVTGPSARNQAAMATLGSK
jgi:N-acetylneuraminic acid mutarotase